MQILLIWIFDITVLSDLLLFLSIFSFFWKMRCFHVLILLIILADILVD